MAFCAKCGSEMQDKFCPTCGSPSDKAGEQNPVPSAPPNEKDAQDNKVMAILSYIIFFIPLLTGDYKKSAFVKFHTNQGTVLFISSVILGVGWGIVTAILTGIFAVTFLWGLIAILAVISNLIWLLPTVLCILGIINAVNRKTVPLPIIGKWTIIK